MQPTKKTVGITTKIIMDSSDDDLVVVVGDDDVAACDMAEEEADRDGPLSRNVRVNVCESMSHQACIEDIVTGLAQKLSASPTLPRRAQARTGEFVPSKHCAVKGCDWAWNRTASCLSDTGEIHPLWQPDTALLALASVSRIHTKQACVHVCGNKD